MSLRLLSEIIFYLDIAAIVVLFLGSPHGAIPSLYAKHYPNVRKRIWVLAFAILFTVGIVAYYFALTL